MTIGNYYIQCCINTFIIVICLIIYRKERLFSLAITNLVSPQGIPQMVLDNMGFKYNIKTAKISI